MIAYRTDRTTRTFKFDFPGNLCRVPCAILAMFCLYLSLFLSLQPSNLSRRLFLKPPPCLAAGPVIQSCQNLFPPSLVALLQLQYAPHRTIYFSCRRNKCCLAAKIYLTADAWAKIFNSRVSPSVNTDCSSYILETIILLLPTHLCVIIFSNVQTRVRTICSSCRIAQSRRLC